MQGAVRSERRNPIRGQLFSRHHLHGDLNAVAVIEFHRLILQDIGGILIDLVQSNDAVNLHVILGYELSVGDGIITGQADLRLDGRKRYALRHLVFGDHRRHGLQQFAPVAVGGFGKLRDNALDLARLQAGNIHALRLEIADHHGRDIVRRQRRG